MKKFILFVLTAIFLALTSCGPEPEIITCFDPQYTLWHVEVLNESADSYSFSFEPVCKLSQTICEMDGLNVTFQVDGKEEAKQKVDSVWYNEAKYSFILTIHNNENGSSKVYAGLPKDDFGDDYFADEYGLVWYDEEAFLHSTYLDESLPCMLFELPTLVVTIDQKGDVSFSF